MTKAEFARHSGRSKMAITKAARGCLSAAVLPGGRIDAAHPDAMAYARKAPKRSEPAAESAYPVSVAEFCKRADVSEAEVRAALSRELREAVASEGMIDLGRPAALAFLARHSFERDASGDPVCPPVNGAGWLAPAVVGERIDTEHPVANAFLARCGVSL